MSDTTIEWTGKTWNPVTGCTKVSPGCKNCYAERMANRLQAMGQRNYKNGFELTLQPHMLALPLKWKKPQTIFVNSMSDLFHESVPDEYIAAVFGVMAASPQHTFQVLTKRAERLPEWFSRVELLDPLWAIESQAATRIDMRAGTCAGLPWPLPNVWLGVSVEDRKYGIPRIEHLRRTPATVRFLSIEPLLEDIGEIDLTGIDWVIVGCESGPGARHAPLEWVRSVRDQVLAARTQCSACSGFGTFDDWDRPATEASKCAACGGLGWHGPALFIKQLDVCEVCSGVGDAGLQNFAGRCPHCDGTGQTGAVRKGCPALDRRVHAEYPVR